ncbi:hypothetical protein [Nocardioides yefusunii]|uniref:Uncharacterized protein n=1 Tax=Nocardioides yefusunii TaxID=2500546 RepID=A0ABW1QZ99_9ACTN|nr:hypothetical protein [Nocardioides yefusunii]
MAEITNPLNYQSGSPVLVAVGRIQSPRRWHGSRIVRIRTDIGGGHRAGYAVTTKGTPHDGPLCRAMCSAIAPTGSVISDFWDDV